MTTPVCPSYAGYRFAAEVISHAVWLYFRFPLSLRMVEEILAARGIIVSHETVRAGQTSRQTPASQAAEAAVPPTTGPDHGQAGQLWGREEGDHARCRAPAAQGL